MTWRLLNEMVALICSRDAPVLEGEWRASLPKTYIDRLRMGDWRVEAATKQ